MLVRSLSVVLTSSAAALLMATAPADDSSAAVSPAARATAQAAGVRPMPAGYGSPRALHPDSRLIDDVLNGDSCANLPDEPTTSSECVAVGYAAAAPYVNGIEEYTSNGKWYSNIFGSLGNATDPLEVSCVPQEATLPSCVAVGEFYENAEHPMQLLATGGANGFSPVTLHNPKGTKWSTLDSVSCASTAFCMVVGTAGTTRKTAHGLRYIGHATAFRWNGASLRSPAVPAPAHAKTSELAGVSCPSTTSCVAVGNYTSAAGRSLPYSALWSDGSWKVRTTPTVKGKSGTFFQDISCPAVTSCVAVGDAEKPGITAFAERYAAGRWTVQRIAAERSSTFYGVSCPTTSSCVAVGVHAGKSLIESWSGTKWTAQSVPTTSAPFTTDVLQHVSCLSPEACTAVGYRHNPASKFANRTLALGWNGAKWSVQKTINQ